MPIPDQYPGSAPVLIFYMYNADFTDITNGFNDYDCVTDSSCNDAFQVSSSCYKVHRTERVPWFTAVNRCLSYNASLAVFDDSLHQYIPSSVLSDKAWIGLLKSRWTWTRLGQRAYTCLSSSYIIIVVLVVVVVVVKSSYHRHHHDQGLHGRAASC